MTLRISWSEQDGGSSTEHTLAFDAVISESHEAVSELTEHAIESGAPISDHKRDRGARIIIEALVTQTPLDAPPSTGALSSPVTAEIRKDEDLQANVLVFSQEFDRLSDAFLVLEELRLSTTSVTLSTRINVYDEVQIVRVFAPRSPKDGDAIQFRIECKPIRTAETRVTDAPEPREARGNREWDRGDQAAREATEEERESSYLADLANWALG